MKELIGHKIIDLEIADGEYGLRFTTDNNKHIIYIVDADCCAESWFSEIMNVDFLINHTISEVVELELPNTDEFMDNHTRQKSDCFYGYQIATEAGHTTIVFRCSSNGYYGGSCSLSDGPRNDLKWKSIKHLSDWTAYEPDNKSYVHILKLKAFL